MDKEKTENVVRLDLACKKVVGWIRKYGLLKSSRTNYTGIPMKSTELEIPVGNRYRTYAD
jgi:hypothetical protein